MESVWDIQIFTQKNIKKTIMPIEYQYWEKTARDRVLRCIWCMLLHLVLGLEEKQEIEY